MSSTRVSVESGYRCPFCPDHRDDVFYKSALIDVPICEGCEEELFNFCEWEERPKDALIDQVEHYTGRTWEECRVVLLRDYLKDWQTRYQLKPQEWLNSARQHLNLNEDEAWAYAHRRLLWYTELVAAAEAALKPK